LTEIEKVLAELEQQEDVVIVQIGAYVGDTPNDPLVQCLRTNLSRFPGSRALLVEPVREYFELLKDNYADLPGAVFENVALAAYDGECTFFRIGVDPSRYGQPDWLTQCGSTRPDRMEELWDSCESEGDPEIKAFWHEHSLTETVPCLRFETLLARHGITHVDFLQIDTEGSDYDILRTIDFSRVRPDYINYEHELLNDDKPACRAMLQAAGYELHDWGETDTLARAVAPRPAALTSS
jgi:FkbM family methyltransferase